MTRQFFSAPITLIAVVGLLLAFATNALAVQPLRFDDPAKQQRFETLLKELRCLVCQNQSLASSEAGLATDLRQAVHAKVDAGQSDAEIRQYLVDRYGEYVLYRPRLNRKTWLLWFGPAFLALAGLLALIITVKKRARIFSEDALENSDRERLQQLLQKHDDGAP